MLKPSIFVGGHTKDSRSFFYLAMYLIAVFSFLVSVTASVYYGAQDRERVRYEHLQSSGFNVVTIPAAYGDYQVFGFAIETGDSNKQQPPIGLTNWIEPGEVAVSPRLANLFPIGTLSPWGQVVQLIDERTLSTPTEYFFILR